MRAYVILEGKEYWDYKLIVKKSGYSSYTHSNPEAVLINDTMRKKLFSLDNPAFDKSFCPKKGDMIYVAPNNPRSVYDLRNNYKLKRKPDDGVCNVFYTPKEHSWKYNICTQYIGVIEKIKTIVINIDYGLSRTDFITSVLFEVPGISQQDITIYHYDYWYAFFDYGLPDSFFDFINGKFTKPCIHIDRLPLTTENELTVDILDMIKEAFMRPGSSNDEKNLLIQLNMLNQCNWRECRFAVHTLLFEICRDSKLLREMNGHRSRYQKPIKEMLSDTPEDFTSEKDFLLTREYLEKLLCIGKAKYVSAQGLINKLAETNITIDTFNKVYNNIVRLTPREYDKKKADNDTTGED